MFEEDSKGRQHLSTCAKAESAGFTLSRVFPATS